MFTTLNLKQLVEDQLGKGNTLDPRTANLFDKIVQDSSGSLFSHLFGRKAKPILLLGAVADEAANRHYAGSRSIAVRDIHGTIDRDGDFDYEFAPLKRTSELRWRKVATAMLNGLDLPPVELIQVGEEYFVKDGHHRISVARALGFAYIDAIVEVWG